MNLIIISRRLIVETKNSDFNSSELFKHSKPDSNLDANDNRPDDQNN